ncbi:MAG: AAA family ATPase [Bacteroidales bacterium]
MKIVAIRIENIASLGGEHTIDFTSEPLSSASLFAITGPTGSGKSTILDAITLALYTTTPRSKIASSNVKLQDGNIQQSDVRNLLRRGSGIGYAEVDFVALDGLTYRSRCTIKRARNRATGAFQAITLQVRELKSDKELQGTLIQLREQLVALLGLTYEQFTRTVLLAQGEFANFLRAGDNEKSDLLMKLTGSEQFNKISMEIYNRSLELSRQVKELEARVEHLEILTPEELAEVESSLNILNGREGELKQQLERLNSQLSWWGELERLQQLLANSQSQLDKHRALIESSAPKRRLLEMSDSISPLRPIDARSSQLSEQLISVEKKLSELTESIRLSEQEISDISIKQRVSKSKIEEEQRIQREHEPFVESARKLDGTIRTLNESLEQLEGKLKEINVESKELTQLLTAQKEQERATNQEIMSIKEWFEQHSNYQTLVPNAELLHQSITKYNIDHKALTTLKEQIASYSIKREEIDKNVAQLLESSKLLEDSIKQKSDALTALRDTQQESLESLQAKSQKLDGELKSLQELRNRVKSIEDSEREITKYRGLITKDEISLKDIEISLGEIEIKLPLIHEQLESHNQLLEQAERTISLSVASLRSTLKENSPCPVCGSSEHPYADYLENELSSVAQELRRKQKESQDCYNHLLTTREKSIFQIGQLRERVDGNNQELTKQLSIHQSERELYLQSAMAQSLMGEMITVDRLDIIIKECSEAREFQNNLIDKAIQHQKLLESLSNEISEMQKSRLPLQAKIELSRGELNDLNTLDSRDKALHDSHRSELAILYKQLTGQLSSYFDYEVWGDVYFPDTLQTISKQWNIYQSQLTTLERELHDIQIKIARSEADNRRVIEQLSSSELELSRVKIESLSKVAQRSELLNAMSVDDYIRSNQEKIALLDRELKSVTESYNNLDKQLSSQTGAHKQSLDLQVDLSKQLEITRREFNSWIEDYNTTHETPLTIEDVQKILHMPIGSINTIREEIESLERELTKLTTERKLHDDNIKKHSTPEQTPELSVDDINTQKGVIVAQQAKLESQLKEINYKLLANRDNLAKRSDVQKSIDAIKPLSDRWSNLNSLFGSAQGDSFRKIAMGFTLDYLLEYANIDLQRINERYQLERIEDTLQLMVVDRYMCDDRRSAASLSGGETFIVSLSLALGLSSLTSEKMQIETLFIDEGFGALDPDTLRMAMEALNTLHTQGRKVGVISHVQEMTEQIATRIELVSLGGGSSRLEIR